jgi:hypothetical protein
MVSKRRFMIVCSDQGKRVQEGRLIREIRNSKLTQKMPVHAAVERAKWARDPSRDVGLRAAAADGAASRARSGDGYAAVSQRVAGVSGVGGHVSDYHVRLGALGIQVGVGVVLGDTPYAEALVPERRPGQVLGQERGDPRGGIGVGRVVSSVIR